MVSEKSLRRWTNAELERVRKVWAVVSFWSVVELRERICGASVGEFRAGGFVALWSVPGAERTAEGGSGEASVWGDSGGCSGRFEIPRSTRKSRQQRPRASRFRGSVPAGGRVWNLARRSADHDAKF